jgi:hypothetical protein
MPPIKRKSRSINPLLTPEIPAIAPSIALEPRIQKEYLQMQNEFQPHLNQEQYRLFSNLDSQREPQRTQKGQGDGSKLTKDRANPRPQAQKCTVVPPRWDS